MNTEKRLNNGSKSDINTRTSSIDFGPAILTESPAV